MAAAVTAAAGAAAGAAATQRLVLVVLVCAALAAALPSKNKEGNEAVASNSAAAGAAAAAAAGGEGECVSGHSKADGGSGCGGYCYCLGGQWVCPECVNEGPSKATKKLRTEDLEPMPLRRSKRETSDVTAIVIAERCVPHTRFRVDCNTCLCPTSGIQARASCTTGQCPTPRPTPRPLPTPAPEAVLPSVDMVGAPANLQLAPAAPATPPPPTTAPPPTTEGTTIPPCTWEEKTAGNTTHCVPVPLDGERCAPGVTYMDECNTCICSQDGIKAHASCTFKVCPK